MQLLSELPLQFFYQPLRSRCNTFSNLPQYIHLTLLFLIRVYDSHIKVYLLLRRSIGLRCWSDDNWCLRLLNHLEVV